MESPFPGMDPYLEQHWRSVHHRLITYAGDQLQAVLPRRYRVEVEERVFIAGLEDAGRSVFPDVHVVDAGRTPRTTTPAARDVAIAEPVVIELPDEPVTELYLEIIDLHSGNKVITAIEFLSPTNKIAGDGNELYVRKQRDYRGGSVSQVEIDLTRQGDRGLVLPMNRIPPRHRATYLACVHRAWEPQKIEVYPVPLQDRLPTIGVPVHKSVADAPLNLQDLVDQCYHNGRYDDVDYRRDPAPGLQPEDAAWADQLLRSKGLR
jgi:hypothetical protein